MSNALLGYLNKRLKDDSFLNKANWETAGPVITISREVGCEGLKLAHLIANRLNERKMLRNWRVLSKEIFHQSANELNMHPEHIRKVLKQSDKYVFEEILKAFNNKSYKSERKIVNTVKDAIRSFAIEGYSIIVGRAGHIIANDINSALHLRLTAPLDYRIETIKRNDSLNTDEAIKFINKVEKERIAFRKSIRHEQLGEDYFDMTINRANFISEHLVDIIEYALDKKGILQNENANVQYY